MKRICMIVGRASEEMLRTPTRQVSFACTTNGVADEAVKNLSLRKTRALRKWNDSVVLYRYREVL